MDLELRNKRALVTGGSKGIGKAIARMRAQEGPTSRCWRATRSMRSKGWGRIVNVSGQAARQTGNAAGSMRNISVTALTKNMADELGPAGINVTVVHPGLTRTGRTAPLIATRADALEIPPQAVEAQMAAGNSIHHLVDAIAVGGGIPRSIHYQARAAG